MALVAVGSTPEMVNRRSVDAVLGIPSGPSRRGSTYWSRALHCPWEHLLANVLGWRSAMPSDPLDTGLIWHHLLEVYYQEIYRYQQRCIAAQPDLDRHNDLHFLCGHDASAQQVAVRAVLPFATEPGYELVWEKIERMIDVYFTRWRGDRWEIVDVETTFDYDDGEFAYTARLDLVVIDHQLVTPVTRVIEHKSAYRMDSMVMEGYTQDLQTLGQVWVVTKRLDMSQYPPFLGSLVNITSKTKVPQCDRIPLSPSPMTLAVWESSMRRYAKLLPVYEEMGYPKNYANCTRRYGRCEFFSLCRTNPELDLEGARDGGPPPDYETRGDHV